MIIDGILHPAWTLDFITHEPLVFANVVDHADKGVTDAMPMAQHVMQNFDQRLSWNDVEWLQSIWSGPIVLKGIQTVDDALRARRRRCAGDRLSNHGGRQLDDAPSPIELVEPVAQAVQGRAAIICDGGVRRGSDIVKAIALGADACSIGRPYLYGAAAAGERGVDHVLQFFRDGLERTMALTGTALDRRDRSRRGALEERNRDDRCDVRSTGRLPVLDRGVGARVEPVFATASRRSTSRHPAACSGSTRV